MSEDKKPSLETEEIENENESRKGKRLAGLFYHNTFVLVFSFCVALIGWFIMASGNTENNKIVPDVPITVNLSGSAAQEGIRVFSQSYNEVDLEISGNSLITNKLSPDDFTVSATLNPSSTKLTGNTMQKATIPVRAVKNSAISDFNIVSVTPEEITVEYDRFKETTFTLDQSFKYSADTGYYAGVPALSESTVTVSGPESSVNKISRAVLSHTLSTALRSDAEFTCAVQLYDRNDQPISDISSLYLTMDFTTVDVSIPVLSKKTVLIRATTVHQPNGFSDNRITVEPSQIEIVGTKEALADINEITLDTPIDFAELDVTGNNSYTLDISLPAGVRNISTAGDNPVSQAKVSINLNGYKKTTLSVPADNFQIINKPAGKDVNISVLALEVSVIGSEAQTNKLTGDTVSVQMDMANFANRSGAVEVPVTVTLTGTGSDSCWILGKYTVYVTVADSVAASQAAAEVQAYNDMLNASPQE